MGIMKKISSRLHRLRGSMDAYQQNITFAEADQHQYITGEEKFEEPALHKGKLLVVGRESEFPTEVIDYAMEMAQRMSYDIVALNTAPLSCDSFKFFSFSQSTICKEFQEISEKNAQAFQQLAASKGIGFSHVVRFKETETAIAEIGKEYHIDFVVEEPQEWVHQRPETENRLQKEIFVYTMH